MKDIAQRKLWSHSGSVAVISPHQKRQWVPREDLLRILRSQPPDRTFFEDLEEMGGTLADLEVPWQR